MLEADNIMQAMFVVSKKTARHSKSYSDEFHQFTEDIEVEMGV
jgi:hypothetical protein